MPPENSPQIIVSYQISSRKISPQRTAPGIIAIPRKIVIPLENCSPEPTIKSPPWRFPPEKYPQWANSSCTRDRRIDPGKFHPRQLLPINCPTDYSLLDNCTPKIPVENWPPGIVAPWMKYVPSSFTFFAFCEEQNLPCYFAVYAKAN